MTDLAGPFLKESLKLSLGRLRTACVLTITLYLLFFFVDWVVFPEHLWIFLLTNRIPVVTLHLICLGLTYTGLGRRYPWAIAMVVFTSIGLGVVHMVLHTGGGESLYYAGLICVILGYTVLMPWRVREACITSGILYLSYFGSIIALGKTGELRIFFTNNCFLLSTIVIAITSSFVQYRLRFDEFVSRNSLADANRRLKEMDRLKSQFFSNITHELRTPLTMILSPIESMIEGEMGEFSGSQRKYLVPIRRNALKLLKLINDLLDLARIEERFMRIRVERTDLTELLSEIVEHAKPLAARKHIDLELQLRSVGDDLYVDAEKMERAIINLISNALKFTEEQGRVTLMLEAFDEEVRIGVLDTGVGIPRALLERIFERFSQADGSITRRFGGTGIGLALARELVELHGGRLTVDSAEGQGSLFSIHLPRGRRHLKPEVLDRRQVGGGDDHSRRVDDREPQEWTRQLLEQHDYRFLDIEEVTERRLASREDAATRATKVLVVEDNVEVLKFIHMQLRDEHAVYLGRDGAHGLVLARRELPDVIITDFMMPEMDGLTMIRKLRDDPGTASIPVIMLTAKNRLEDRLEVREAGADIYLTKPFSPKELRSSIRGLLERQGRQADVFMRAHVRNLEVISAGLAHEIHNPLSYIKNAFVVISEKVDAVARTLEDDELDEQQRTRRIHKSLARMDRMREIARRGIERIEQLVQLVRRYAREGYPEEPTPMVFDAAVRDVGKLITAGGDREVQVELKLQAGEAAVQCVPEEMHQVIRNLWQNAVEAVDDNGHVRIETRCEDGVVVLEVVDDGMGIPKENLHRVFTPFFTSKEPGKGLGLGLAISQHVVNRSGGSIDVESIPGQMTAFRVQLPRLES